jgi:hypothetical protein
MYARLSSHFAVAMLVATGLVMYSVTAGAQEDPIKGFYQVEIDWRLVRGTQQVKILEIREEAFGDAKLFRDRNIPLRIHAKLVSPDSIKFELKQMPLSVKDPHPFSVIAMGVDGVGGPSGSKVEVHKMTGKTLPLAKDYKLIVFDWSMTHTVPAGTIFGTFRVNHACEVCAENPCTLGLD